MTCYPLGALSSSGSFKRAIGSKESLPPLVWRTFVASLALLNMTALVECSFSRDHQWNPGKRARYQMAPTACRAVDCSNYRLGVIARVVLLAVHRKREKETTSCCCCYRQPWSCLHLDGFVSILSVLRSLAGCRCYFLIGTGAARIVCSGDKIRFVHLVESVVMLLVCVEDLFLTQDTSYRKNHASTIDLLAGNQQASRAGFKHTAVCCANRYRHVQFLYLQALGSVMPMGSCRCSWFLAFALGFASRCRFSVSTPWLPDAHVEAPHCGFIYRRHLLKLATYVFIVSIFRCSPPPVRRELLLYGHEHQFGVRSVMIFLASRDNHGGGRMYFGREENGDVKNSAYSSVSSMASGWNVCAESKRLECACAAHDKPRHLFRSFVPSGGIIYGRGTRERANSAAIALHAWYAAFFRSMVMTAIGLPYFAFSFPSFYRCAVPSKRIRCGRLGRVGNHTNGRLHALALPANVFRHHRNPKNEKLSDLSAREWIYMTPLVILSLWIGVYPKPFLGYIERPVNAVVRQVRPSYPIPGMPPGLAVPQRVAVDK